MRCNYPPAFRVGWPAFDMREAGFVGFCVCLWPGFDYGTQIFKNKAPITFRCFWVELWSRHRLEEMCYWLRIQPISHIPLVDPVGFEPATFGLWVRCSDLLSYGSGRNVVLTNFAPSSNKKICSYTSLTGNKNNSTKINNFLKWKNFTTSYCWFWICVTLSCPATVAQMLLLCCESQVVA